MKADDRVRILVDSDDRYTMSISAVEESHMGCYLCKAVNSLGEQTSAATIVITGNYTRKLGTTLDKSIGVVVKKFL